MNKTKKNNDMIKRFLIFFVGCLILSLGFNFFFLPLNIVYGGVSGISIVLNKALSIDPSTFVFIANIFLLILSYFTLGKEKTKGSICGSILYPLCIKLTASLPGLINFQIDDVLLSILFGAVVAGIAYGINFKAGFTTGGTDIINQIISKYCHVSMGNATIMSDGLILLAAGFFVGQEGEFYAFTNVMYAIIVLYVISIITDKIMLGISKSKCFYIVTDNETEMKKFLTNHLEHGVTVLDGRGGYTGNNQKVIMCIVPTKEYFIVKEGIHKIDSKAFFVVTDAYESQGGQ